MYIFFQTVCFSVFISVATRALYCVIICVPRLARKTLHLKLQVDFHVILLFCRSRSLDKNCACWCPERVYFVSLGNFWLKKRQIQPFCCKSKIVFVNKNRACKSSRRVRISILINKNYFSGLLFFSEKTPPNTEYIFSRLAVIIKL